MKSSKPILIGGITLSVGLWALNNLYLLPFPLEDLGVLSAIALGGGLWLLQKRDKVTPVSSILTFLTSEDVNKAITSAETAFQLLEKEAKNYDLSSFKLELNQLAKLTDQESFKINIIGEKYSGKTSLRELLNQELNQPLIISENLDLSPHPLTPSPKVGRGGDNVSHEDKNCYIDLTNKENENYDLILFLINGDLTDSQWQNLQQLKSLNYRVILLLNKQDRYLPEEKFLILQQIKTRVNKIIPESDILAIATKPTDIKVRQYQKDGTIKEYLEKQLPQFNDFVKYLEQILTVEKGQLNLQKTWRNAFYFQEKIKAKLNQIRKETSLPIIEKYQWIAAGAIFANPISSLDLLATAAINGQLLVDLSEIYQQKFTLDQAQNIASMMGKLMVQLGLVELSTQTISSLLKSNAITYIAGGTIQGISAAYLTRIAGLSLIEYYQEQDMINIQENSLNLEKLGEKIKQIFQENQRTDFYKNFVKQALKFKPV